MIKVIKFFNIFFLFLPIFLFSEGGSNNPQVTITPSTKSITEGNSGQKTISFTVSISECPTLSSVKVKVVSYDGTAKSGSDYISINQAISFSPGNSCTKSRTVSVAIKGDKSVEADESFTLQLSNNGTNSVQNFRWGNQIAKITIKNDDNANDNKADLSITKSNDKAPNKAEVGDIITYTIVGKNNGPKSTKVYIWDTLPTNLTFISVTDNKSSFNCSYYSNDKKIRCRGNRVFNAGDSVTITIKAKVKNTKKYTTTNYSGIKSDSSPRIADSNSKNNRASSSFKVKQIDIQVKKWVKKGTRYVNNYDNPPSYPLNSTIRYKIQIKNRKDHPTQIQFWDTIPNGLQLLSVEIEGNPSNYRCDINGNKVHCYGSKIFGQNVSQNIFITVKGIKKGAYFNGVWAESQNDNIYYDRNKNNNWDDVPIYVGTTTDNEAIKEFSKRIKAPKSRYEVGDIIEFELSAKTAGIDSRYLIRDWENDNGTSSGAFKFLSVYTDSNSNMSCSIENPNRASQKFINCETKQKISAGKNLKVYLKVQLKKSGKVCNRAHIYKEFITSGGTDYKWMNEAQICFNVNKEKKPPILKANEFHVRLNKTATIDLKNYTTDPDTPKNQLRYSIISGSLPDGYSMTQNGVISGKYTNSSGTFPKRFTLKVKVVDPDGLSSSDSFTIVVDATKIDAINNYYKIPINSVISGNFISDKTTWGSKVYKPDIGENLKVIQVVKLDRNITWSSDGSFTYYSPKKKGLYHITYTVEDKYGQRDTATVYFDVFKPNIKANDDIFNVAKNTPLHSNLFVDNGNGADVGEEISIKNYTKPDHGTLFVKKNGDLVFTPDKDYTGVDKFTYSIVDKYGQVSSATVLLKIGIQHIQGYVDFRLVNPPESRNLIGNYIVAGNTISCISTKKGLESESDSYNGICQKNRNIANNDYVVKYIDIDQNSATWNSSAAKFELPQSYLSLENGKGVVWAGLFWQGSVNNRYEGYKQRRAYATSLLSYKYKDITKSTPVDIASTDADKVLVSIDNKAYKQVKADTLYYDTAHGDYGGYYAAYKNITQLLQDANLSKGEHTITIANITSNEGREAQVGNYGGWALVIIYKEDFTGKPRNISIYNGYQPLGFGGNTNYPEKEITISGFKLPKSGEVDAQISAFVGEGEKKYGGSSLIYDKMYIKDIAQNHQYDMPVAYPNNIFDGAITNDKETPIPNQTNTNGIDIDNYDVSKIIQDIRDKKKDTSEIIIGLVSKDEDNKGLNDSDYVTASMLAFSTQLYAPKMCYDYSIRLGEFIKVEHEDRNFEVENYLDDKLQLKIMIKSQEADFDLIESKLYASFTPDTVFEYIKGSAKYSPPNTIDYLPALETDSKKGEIAIGSNVSLSGGVIGEKETTYAKLYYSFKKDFKGKFDIYLNSKISFDGITKVPYQMSTAAPENSIFFIERCPTNPVYDPLYGILNVERGDSKFSQSPEKRYALYTQVTGVPYTITLASYTQDAEKNYTIENPINLIAEVELIDAGTFDNNASAGYDTICQDPDTYQGGVFVDLKNSSRSKVIQIPDDYENYPENLALKNAAFRSWVLTRKDNNGTRVLANYPTERYNSIDEYFKKLYSMNYINNANEPNYCATECSTATEDKSCYHCLRKHYGMPICSRDNFAIRPNSYSIALKDTNQSTNTVNTLLVGVNDATTKNIAAGYVYTLDINATMFKKGTKSRDNVIGYTFRNNNQKKKALLTFSASSLKCDDNSSTAVSLLLKYGKSYKTTIKEINNTFVALKNSMIVNNAGVYALHIEDSEWTEVDQVGYKFRPFPNNIDCISNSSNLYYNNPNAKRGCLIATNRGSDTWPDLLLRSHPYSFDLTKLTSSANPNSDANYIYINNLTQAVNSNTIGYSNIMSLAILGTIEAKGKNGVVLSNYTSGCMAQDSNITIEYFIDRNTTTLQSSSNRNVAIESFLYREEVDNAPILNGQSTAKQRAELNISFAKRYFYTSGEGLYGSYINFARRYDDPINPFKLTIGRVTLKSPQDSMSVDLQASFIPSGFVDLNSTKSFLYAKVKSKRDFYDDISTNAVKTPIEIDLYCDKSLEYCKDYEINVTNGITNEYNWWINLNHDASKGDGKVYLQTNNSAVSVLPNEIADFSSGVDNNVTVKITSNLELPVTVKILPTQFMKDNYSYLLYNKSANIAPSFIYKVRFVSPPAAWSGEGKTGFTIDENSSGKRTKRIDW